MDSYTLADRLHLGVIRGLIAAEVGPLQRLAVLTATLARLEAMLERDVHLAYAEGASHAAVGRALGITRQAARERAVRRHPQAAVPAAPRLRP